MFFFKSTVAVLFWCKVFVFLWKFTRTRACSSTLLFSVTIRTSRLLSIECTSICLKLEIFYHKARTCVAQKLISCCHQTVPDFVPPFWCRITHSKSPLDQLAQLDDEKETQTTYNPTTRYGAVTYHKSSSYGLLDRKSCTHCSHGSEMEKTC